MAHHHLESRRGRRDGGRTDGRREGEVSHVADKSSSRGMSAGSGTTLSSFLPSVTAEEEAKSIGGARCDHSQFCHRYMCDRRARSPPPPKCPRACVRLWPSLFPLLLGPLLSDGTLAAGLRVARCSPPIEFASPPSSLLPSLVLECFWLPPSLVRSCR